MPKKMRRLALRCVLSAKAADEELRVLQGFELDEPKTRELARILKAVGAESSALVVTAESDANVYKSARSLKKIDALPAPLLNVADLLSHQVLVITVDAVRQVEAIWGRKEAQGIAS
jgi:large subunit ribosomal protein L4